MGTTRTLRDDENQHYYSRALTPRPSTASSSVWRFSCSSKSERGTWSELPEPVLSRLSQSVVSIASFIGHAMFAERTGLCIQTSYANAPTSFLTSASLFPRTAEGKISDNVTIKIRLPNNQIVTGQIEHHHHDVNFDFALVKVEHVAGFHTTHLDRNMPFEANRKVVAVWRCFNSGLLMATSGVELGSPAAEPHKIMLSTCTIDMAGIGGPLVDFGGNFVGMNCNRSEPSMTPFIKRVLIHKLLGNHGIVSMGTEQTIDGTREGISTSEIQKYSTPVYPHLINSPEDVFDGDIWSELPQGIASRISRSVVALASFDGDATFFACTGFVSHCDANSAYILTSASLVRFSGDMQEIKSKLRIEVSLSNGFRVIGILEEFDLSFNLACIKIMGHWDLLALELHPENLQTKGKKPHPESLQRKGNELQAESSLGVIAVGCRFDGFHIMATGGLQLMNCQSKLDCSELHVSSCKITKAGVGGPLIDFDGNLLGMNFYHDEETPFLKTYYLCAFLGSRGLGQCVQQYKCSYDFSPGRNKAYRWPLPKPFSYNWPLRKHKYVPTRYKVVDLALANKGTTCYKAVTTRTRRYKGVEEELAKRGIFLLPLIP